MGPRVVGFQSDHFLGRHFQKHIERLAALGIVSPPTVDAYERRAIEFLSRPLDGTGIVLERVPISTGDTIRFDQETCEFGVVCGCGFVHTYFVIDANTIRDRCADPTTYFYLQIATSPPKRPCCLARRAP